MYKVIRKAISEELAQFVYEYFLMKRKVARKFYDDRYISPFNYDWGVWNDEFVPETSSMDCHEYALVLCISMNFLRFSMETNRLSFLCSTRITVKVTMSTRADGTQPDNYMQEKKRALYT